MRFLASSIAVLAMTAIMPPVAPGQGAPGTNLSVDVNVSSVTLSGDTVTVEYVLFNRGSSAEELVFFTVNAPAPPISLSLPQPSQAWKASTLYRERSVARWAALKTIPPGAASPRISFRAVGVPAIVTAWYRGNRLPTLGEDDPEVQHPDPETPTPDVDPLTAYSVPTQTVGIEPVAPGATPASLTSRLETLTGESCSLGWISQQSLCTTLRGHLTAQPVRLASFKSDLDAGHTTSGPVNDNAYWLLKTNADYIQSVVSGIRLTYICGNKFRVRNPSGVTVPVSWDVYQKNETGSLTLPPRATGQLYSETFFTTVNKGTVRLFHEGQLIQTKANGGAVCP